MVYTGRTAQEVNGVALGTLTVENLNTALGIDAPYGTRVNLINAIHDLFEGGEFELLQPLTNLDLYLCDPAPATEDTTTLLPSEVELRVMHNTLQTITHDPTWYSNPCNKSLLPFPMRYTYLPVDRFDLKQEKEGESRWFEYMGRESFKTLWDFVESFQIRTGFSQLYLQGIMGSGKSHILAAFTCLLFRIGRRPVYLPDCRQMLMHPLSYIQTALLGAFADPSSSRRRNVIRSFQTLDDALHFCQNLGSTHLYFVVDQMNALEEEGCNSDKVKDAQKNDLGRFLMAVTIGHYVINSVSANYRTMQYMRRKQTGEIRMSMMGGMSEAEMKHWWVHQKGKVPEFQNTIDRERVEDLTGCIPLLLRPLFPLVGKEFCEIESDFWGSEELKIVKSNVHNFADTMRREETPQNYISYYLEALFQCLTGLENTFEAKWLDSRYFWRDEITGSGHYTCGLAREAGAAVIWKAKPSKFLDDRWLNALDSFEKNPSVVGFLAEQTCLSAISNLGFHHRVVRWDPVEPKVFSGDIFDALPSATSKTFYVPKQWNYKDLNALYLDFDITKKRVFIVPIQICLDPRHKDSEALFYADWGRWQKRFHGYTLSTTFVWIVEHKRTWKVIEMQSRSDSQLITPHHRQIHVTAGEVYGPLGSRLESRYRSLKSSHNLPPGLIFSSDDESDEPEQLLRQKTRAKTKAAKKAKDTNGSDNDAADPMIQVSEEDEDRLAGKVKCKGGKGKTKGTTKEDDGTKSQKRKREPSDVKSNKKATPASRRTRKR